MEPEKTLDVEYAFQPIIDIKKDSLFGYEALIRPGESPEKFIHRYEVKGNLHVIEKTTFFEAIRMFLDRDMEGKLFLNSFPSESLTKEEFKELDHTYGDKVLSRLVIELLEYPEQSDEAWAVKKKFIEQHNMMLAIDDFGAGINNVDILLAFTPDIVKLDRELVRDIDKDKRRGHLLEMITTLIKDKGIKVLAEGVETEGEYDYLRGIDVDFMQGFYIARPILVNKETERIA